MKIIFATLVTYTHMGVTLTECNHEDRLLSYYLLKNFKNQREILEHYVSTGLSLPSKRKSKRKWPFDSQFAMRKRRIALRKRIDKYKELELDGY